MDPIEYTNRSNPSVIVHLIGHAQFRLAEMKSPVVIYRRGDNVYVRLASEFHTKFQQRNEPTPTRSSMAQ